MRNIVIKALFALYMIIVVVGLWEFAAIHGRGALIVVLIGVVTPMG